ncbi:MAG: hypothetical protein IJT64_00670 [Kiritimatiellae bacterium]|nr:hypothetical protein [Kiritimatiellia bacterium]
MNRSMIIVSMAMAAGVALAQTMPRLAQGKTPVLEMSFGIGVMGLDEKRTGLDENGLGCNFGMRLGSDKVPVGVEGRMYAASFDLDDDEHDDDKGERFRRYDREYEIAGGDLSVLVNIDRSGPINPYIGAGVFFESVSYEVYEDHGHHRHQHTEWDDDGATYIVRAGLDLRSDALYGRFDAGYIGEVYDSDDGGQFLLSGDIGIYIIDILRIDVFGHYFTEYKSYYAGIGVTLAM